MREFIHVLTVDPGCNSEIPEKFLFWGLVFHGRRVWKLTDASCKYETSCIYGRARTEFEIDVSNLHMLNPRGGLPLGLGDNLARDFGYPPHFLVVCIFQFFF